MVSLSGQPLRHPGHFEHMARRLRHRGPDGTGSVASGTSKLGVARLRIVDPRPRADQPFSSGSWVLAANGEVYNAPELRCWTARYPYRSRSDIETVLALVEQQGVRGLRRVHGMFGLALWHEAHRTLVLARDPAGEKPLFWTRRDGEIWFASEVQALLHPSYRDPVDDAALAAYLALGYVPEPATGFRRIAKVEAGTALVFTAAGPPERVPIVPDAPASPGLEASILRAVARQSAADVPVGVFVSGGIDSGLVAALATDPDGRRLPLFTARFADRGFDESGWARHLANHLAAPHHEVIVDATGMRQALEAIRTGLAEPLADPAILPTWLLAREARTRVGVVLTGEGADEWFGGYPTYLGHRAAARLDRVPPKVWAAVSGLTRRAAAGPGRVQPGYLLHRFARHAADPPLERHLNWFGTGLLPALAAPDRAGLLDRLPDVGDWEDPVRAAMALDIRTALRDGLLVKADRATMAHGLEARAPFLDPMVTTAASRLSPEQLVWGGRTKIALRSLARHRLPRALIRRVKRGMSVPVARWINAELAPEVDRLFRTPGFDRIAGLLPGCPPAQLLSEHRRGQANHGRPLWAIVMLLYWLEHWGRD